MIVCSICKKFVSNVRYRELKVSGEIIEVKGKCKKHGVVDCDWDCYEDLDPPPKGGDY
jgi:hypothetical protein